MQLGFDVQIPDGLLAANALLAENSRQGFATGNRAPYQGLNRANCTAALGLSWSVASGTCSTHLMGRFMSPDWAAKAEPVPYAKLDNPQTLNLYAYVGNNPLSRTDADGHCWWQAACDAAKSAFATGALLVHDSNVRANYIADAKGVLTGKGQWSPVRAFAKVQAQGELSGIGKGVTAVAEKAAEGVEKGMTGTATRASVNALAENTKVLGAAGIVAGVGVSAYNVANAPEGERARTAAGEGGGLALSLAGAATGAEAGAAIGSLAGPVGTLVGGVVGGVIGGYEGGKEGKQLGTQVYDSVTHP